MNKQYFVIHSDENGLRISKPYTNKNKLKKDFEGFLFLDFLPETHSSDNWEYSGFSEKDLDKKLGKKNIELYCVAVVIEGKIIIP